MKAVGFKKEGIIQQGDITILEIDDLPKSRELKERENGLAIVAHSETGHHHAFDAPPSAVEVFGAEDPFSLFVKVNEPVELKHLRNHDTHKSIMFHKGVFEIKRQRIRRDGSWRAVVD